MEHFVGIIGKQEIQHTGAHLRDYPAIREDKLWRMTLDVCFFQTFRKLSQRPFNLFDIVIYFKLFQEPEDTLCRWRVLG
jgi:hypothetical protein